MGKTTTAVSLAAALARQGRRVLLVDLDSQASASLSVGLGRGELAPSTADVLLRGVAAREADAPDPHAGDCRCCRRRSISRAPRRISPPAAQGDAAGPGARARARGDSTAIFLDCPPGLGLLARNGLAAADVFLVPAIPQFLAVEGVTNLVRAVERLAWRCQSRVRFAGVLPTLVDLRTRSARNVLSCLRADRGDQVFTAEIPCSTRLAEAPAVGRTIFEHAPESTGARAYREASRELLDRLGMRGTPAREELGAAAG